MGIKEQAFLNAEIEINATIDKVWALWNKPEHITHWNSFQTSGIHPKAEGFCMLIQICVINPNSANRKINLPNTFYFTKIFNYD